MTAAAPPTPSLVTLILRWVGASLTAGLLGGVVAALCLGIWFVVAVGIASGDGPASLPGFFQEHRGSGVFGLAAVFALLMVYGALFGVVLGSAVAGLAGGLAHAGLCALGLYSRWITVPVGALAGASGLAVSPLGQEPILAALGFPAGAVAFGVFRTICGPWPLGASKGRTA